MNTKRKIIVLSRHGEAKQKPGGGSLDELVNESVTRLYEKTGKPLYENFVAPCQITPDQTFLTHSPFVRTLRTGQSILIGALNLQSAYGEKIPSSEGCLNQYNFDGIEINQDVRWGNLSGPNCIKLNSALLKQLGMDTRGHGQYLELQLKDPDANILEGKEVTPYREIRAEIQSTLLDSIQKALGTKRFGVATSHAILIDTAALIAVDSARSTPITKLEEIGGPFDMEDYALLILDQKDRSESYQARLERKGQSYPVNLQAI